MSDGMGGGLPAREGTDAPALAEALHALQVHQIELELQNDELRRTKTELELSRARYFDLYDLAPVGYCSINGQGHVVQCNLTLADLLGVPRGALIGQAFARSVSRQDQDRFYRACRELAPGTARDARAPASLAFDCELQMARPDGGLLWVHVKAVQDPQEGGATDAGRPALRMAVTDITQRKQAEVALQQQQQQLHNANQHLEQRVAERTQQLEQARQVAEAALLSRGEFLAKMSHEIRTPLNAIAGMAHLIRMEPLSPLQSERLGKLVLAGEHLLGIINDILDLSKIDANKMALETAPLQLHSIVSNVLAMGDARALDKKLDVVCEIPPHSLNLVGDALRLQQALLNYLSNAIKFTNAGRVTLRVLVQQESEHDALLLFEVADTGIGIAPEALARLFTPFEQADNSISRQYGGTGLGLAITARLAHLMGGTAGARSVPGQGSTFWFSARFAKGAAAAAFELPAQDANAIDTLRTRHPGLRVLVAEDEPVNREIATILLEDAGCLVDAAEDGLQAVTLAAAASYDLILMDMQMPGMDGLEATRRIRQMANHRNTPILAMTANAFVEDRALCLAAGMNAFLTKPVLPAILYTAIVRALA